ncbi:hypothetical protein SEUCBS140593_008614 [Sporothrix eucalyptigena]|uniref:Defect at low temperature protein 1 n=1 Tax=Sporothrix eucalyptigena TaxID=1812306 RepID=A0ABP0CMY0_9PEZI
MASSAQVFFRIIYATVYLFLHVLLLALLLVTPGDIINQSRYRHDVVSILIVAACYIFAILVVTFVFFLRLFLKRAVLNSIPKSWIPIEKGDVSKPVRSMISAGLSRSAAIAFVSRPRVVPEELLDEMCPMLTTGMFMPGSGAEGGGGPAAQQKPDGEKEGGNAPKAEQAVRFKKVETMEMEKELGIDLPPCQAVWGEIEHPGWAPPDQFLGRPGTRGAASPGLAGGGAGAGGGGAGDILDENINLQYSTVLAELPNLIEARALTLAPPDLISPADPPLLDADAVAWLERPAHMGLREYLSHLAGLGVIDLQAEAPSPGNRAGTDSDPRPLSAVVSSFATSYEYARFSTNMLSHEVFRQLMHDLATILRRMTPLDPNLLLDDDEDNDEYDREDNYSYTESDDRSGRPYFAGGNEQDDDDDIDNNAARSSSTTPPRSRSRHSSSHLLTHQQYQQCQVPSQTYDPSPRNTPHPASARSLSGSSRRSAESGSTSSGSSTGSGSSKESDGTSRRRRPHRRPIARLADSSDASPSVSRDQRRQGRSAHRTLLPLRNPSSRASSANSFAQTRHPYAISHQPSTASLRSTASSGSVIRLADRNEQSSLGLPYVIMTPTTSTHADERLF